MSDKARRDDPAKMEQMRTWLTHVRQELGIDQDVVAPIEGDLLGLIGAVAHGPSRPGAPLTAFLVGYATGQGADPVEAIALLKAAAKDWQN